MSRSFTRRASLGGLGALALLTFAGKAHAVNCPVAEGERVGLRVDWPPCSGADPCGGAEGRTSTSTPPRNSS